MTDVVSAKKRSQMMAGIKAVNTRPELMVRQALFKRGFRYRLYQKTLPGKPDLVLKKYNTVIFIHGCFWHGHQCALFKWPKSNAEFWKQKINGNIERDCRNMNTLNGLGWRIIVIWECTLRKLESNSKELFFTNLAEQIKKGKESCVTLS